MPRSVLVEVSYFLLGVRAVPAKLLLDKVHCRSDTVSSFNDACTSVTVLFELVFMRAYSPEASLLLPRWSLDILMVLNHTTVGGSHARGGQPEASTSASRSNGDS